MVIQHNMGVLNASIVLKDNRKKLEKSTEKLSSGYRINRSADDAAGLAISEKMRKKIKGLERGMENVQEGISLCQVADGALNEVSDIIQRVRELSIQAYNGTNSKSDRKVIQDEVDQCLKEMDRVFETTKFNEVYIFRNGNKVEGDTFHPETYIETVWVETVKDIPDWLKINDNSVPLNPDMNDRPKIEEHSGYLNGQTQELNGIMRREFAYVDSAGEEQYIHLYYGNDQGTTADGYRWAGDFLKNDVGTDAYNALMDPNHEFFKYIDQHRDTNGDYTGWTPGFDDNVSAKLDFSELAGVRDAKELYNKLADLVGAEICFPCGTCSNMEAIRFGGEFISVGGGKIL